MYSGIRARSKKIEEKSYSSFTTEIFTNENVNKCSDKNKKKNENISIPLITTIEGDEEASIHNSVQISKKAKQETICQIEIIDVDAFDLDLQMKRQRDLEISTKFRESLLKRKSGSSITGAGVQHGTVNPFFQKKEKKERLISSSSSSSSSSFSSLSTAPDFRASVILFPTDQCIGLNIDVIRSLVRPNRRLRSSTYSGTYGSELKLDILRDYSFVNTDLSLAILQELLQEQKCPKSDISQKCVLPFLQKATPSSFYLRCLWTEYASPKQSLNSHVISLLKDTQDDYERKAIGSPSLEANSKSFITWLLAWCGRKRQKAKSTTKRSSKYIDESDYSDNSDRSDEDGYPNVLALIGPSSSGKSSIVYSCAKELGVNVIELSAGQLRNGSSIKKMISEATQSYNVRTEGETFNLILFDEVDIVFEEDNGFYAAIAKIAKSSKSPIVLTSSEDITFLNNIPIRKLYLYRPTLRDVSSTLSSVYKHANVENLDVGEKDRMLLTLLAIISGNDIRASQSSMYLASLNLSHYELTNLTFSDFLFDKDIDIVQFDCIKENILRSCENLSDAASELQYLKYHGIPTANLLKVFPNLIYSDCINISSGCLISIFGTNFILEDKSVGVEVMIGSQRCECVIISNVCLYCRVPGSIAVGIHPVAVILVRSHSNGRIMSSKSSEIAWLQVEKSKISSILLDDGDISAMWTDRMLGLSVPVPGATDCNIQTSSEAEKNIEQFNPTDDSDERAHVMPEIILAIKPDGPLTSDDQSYTEETGQLLEEKTMQSIDDKISEPPSPYMSLLLSLLLRLTAYPFAVHFFIPINLLEWPTYAHVIKRPINLSSIGIGVLESLYGRELTDKGLQMFIDDTRLVWENCRVFNIEGSLIVQMADFLSDVFELEMSKLLRSQYLFDPKLSYATSRIEQKSDNRTIQHILQTCDGDIEALEIMSDLFCSLSDSDLLLGTGLHILDVMNETKIILEKVANEIVNENEAFAENHIDSNVFDVCDHQANAEVLNSIDLLSHLASALRYISHKTMHSKIQVHPNPAVFSALKSVGRDKSVSTTNELYELSVDKGFSCHIQNYKKHLVENAHLSFLFSKIKNMILVSIVRDMLCGEDTRDMKLTKKFSLVLPKSRLFSLSQETALDVFPGILKIISIERDIASRSSLESFCNSRRPRPARGTVLAWCKPYVGPYPYLSRIFSDLPETLFDMLATEYVCQGSDRLAT